MVLWNLILRCTRIRFRDSRGLFFDQYLSCNVIRYHRFLTFTSMMPGDSRHLLHVAVELTNPSPNLHFSDTTHEHIVVPVTQRLRNYEEDPKVSTMLSFRNDKVKTAGRCLSLTIHSFSASSHLNILETCVAPCTHLHSQGTAVMTVRSGDVVDTGTSSNLVPTTRGRRFNTTPS